MWWPLVKRRSRLWRGKCGQWTSTHGESRGRDCLWHCWLMQHWPRHCVERLWTHAAVQDRLTGWWGWSTWGAVVCFPAWRSNGEEPTWWIDRQWASLDGFEGDMTASEDVWLVLTTGWSVGGPYVTWAELWCWFEDNMTASEDVWLMLTKNCEKFDIYGEKCDFWLDRAPFALFKSPPPPKVMKNGNFQKWYFFAVFLCHIEPTCQKLRFYNQKCEFGPLGPFCPF